MTNLAIILPFTLVVKLPASRADSFFLLPSKLSRGIGRRVMKTAEEREH